MDYLDRGFALILADVLSLITISSCLVIKVPQIRKIVDLKSAAGISLVALLLELGSYTTTMSYNFVKGYPFLSYLEYPILLIQEYVLIFCVLYYSNLFNSRSVLFAIVYLILTILFLAQIIPSSVLTILVPFCTPIGAFSKIMQLTAILRTKDSSTVSETTWLLSAFTNFTRIYTIFVSSADIMLLSNFIISCFLSSSVYVATKFYQKNPIAPKKLE